MEKKHYLLSVLIISCFITKGQARFTNNTPGFIGLNTNSPSSFLNIVGNEQAVSFGQDYRTFLRLSNLSNHNSSLVSIELTAGTNLGKTQLTHQAPSYYFPTLTEYAYFGQLYSRGAGLILRSGSSESPNGIIKFMTGNNFSNGGIERMRILGSGNIGIGTTSPNDPLVVSSNEIPYSEISIGMNNIPEAGNFRRAGHHIGSERDLVFNVDLPHIEALSINNRAYSFRTLGSSNSYSNVKSLMVMNADGNVGIGTFDLSGRNAIQPKAKLHVNEGDIYLDQAYRGEILTSPSGLCFRVSVDDFGNLIRSQIICPN